MFAQSCRVNFAAPTRAHPKSLSRCVARVCVGARERFVVVERPFFAILGTHGTPRCAHTLSHPAGAPTPSETPFAPSPPVPSSLWPPTRPPPRTSASSVPASWVRRPPSPEPRPKPSTPKRHFTIRPRPRRVLRRRRLLPPELDAFDAFDALDALDALDASFPGRSSLSSPSPPRRPHGAQPDQGWAHPHRVEPHGVGVPASRGRGRDARCHRRRSVRRLRRHLRHGLHPRGGIACAEAPGPRRRVVDVGTVDAGTPTPPPGSRRRRRVSRGARVWVEARRTGALIFMAAGDKALYEKVAGPLTDGQALLPTG